MYEEYNFVNDDDDDDDENDSDDYVYHDDIEKDNITW
jgi:hypothetical protein